MSDDPKFWTLAEQVLGVSRETAHVHSFTDDEYDQNTQAMAAGLGAVMTAGMALVEATHFVDSLTPPPSEDCGIDRTPNQKGGQ